MHAIRAIIQPHMLGKLMRTLHEFPHFPGCTVTDARGQGRGQGAGGSYKVTEENIDYHRKVVLEIICADELVSRSAVSFGRLPILVTKVMASFSSPSCNP